jgi:hypothetical protein
VNFSPDIRDQIKEDEMRGVCGTYGRHEECIQNFDGKTCKKEAALKT